MSHKQFIARALYPVPAAELFAWHTRPGAFERLLPPWDPPRFVERVGGIEDGARTVVGLSVGGLPVRFEAEHFGLRPGVEFSDRQVAGPFASWQHTHRVLPQGEASALLEDVIDYQLPAGALGEALGGQAIERRLATLFGYRQRRLAADLARHAFPAARTAGPQTIAISGASGFVGRALGALLGSGGHRVLRLVRGQPRGPDEVTWDPAQGRIDRAALAGVFGVVHLAGENLGDGRWTAARKQAIRNSRVSGTTLIARTLATLPRPPAVFISASAVGYYGQGPLERPFSEEAGPGDDFLASVAADWEKAAAPARDAGIRVVHPRLSTVLHPGGGALGRLLPVFRSGLGGRIGSGKQAMSWITLDDAIGALHQALFDQRLAGPVNLCTETPVSNAQFSATLGRVLGRPALVPVPGLALRAVFGEMAEALLLGGTAAAPTRLRAVGFAFESPDLEGAFAEMLGKGAPATAAGPTPRLGG